MRVHEIKPSLDRGPRHRPTQNLFFRLFYASLKPDDDGSGPKDKARIVAGGDRQVPIEDYDPENISFSVLKNTSLKLLLCKAIELGYQIYHIDIVTAFFNSLAVKFEIFMELPSESGNAIWNTKIGQASQRIVWMS